MFTSTQHYMNMIAHNLKGDDGEGAGFLMTSGQQIHRITIIVIVNKQYR